MRAETGIVSPRGATPRVRQRRVSADAHGHVAAIATRLVVFGALMAYGLSHKVEELFLSEEVVASGPQPHHRRRVLLDEPHSPSPGSWSFPRTP